MRDSKAGDSTRRAAPAAATPAARAPAPSSRVVVLLLALIMLAGLGLRLSHLDWGVPTAPHYRNYYQDERFALGLLFKMNPARLNLDPGYFINPSLHYYCLLGAIGVADAFGLGLKLPVKDLGDLFKPDDVSGTTYRATFLVCRAFAVLLSLAAILLVFLIGRELYDVRAGLFAALLFAFSYPVMYQARFITADGPAVFWLLASLYLLVRYQRSPERTMWRILAPIGIGLAIGAKYLNALMVVPYLYVALGGVRRGGLRQPLLTVLLGFALMLAAFLLTTPYAVLSLHTFLRGDDDGFGGLFGSRGLMFYNNFPPSLTKPFAVTSLAALNALGLLLFAVSLVTAFWRRRSSDVLLLCFVVPFYLLLIAKSSPMLRHILPVLPFVFLLCAGVLSSPFVVKWRTGAAGQVLLGALALSWFLLSVSAVERMGRTDTRIQAEAWARANVRSEAIVVPTYAPYRYTPAIDSFNLLTIHSSDQDWSSATAKENVRALEQAKPEYLLMVEPEYRVNGRSDDRKDYKIGFTAGLAVSRHYVLHKRLAEPFRLLGIEFNPRFPTEDWNYPSPEILIYKLR